MCQNGSEWYLFRSSFLLRCLRQRDKGRKWRPALVFPRCTALHPNKETAYPALTTEKIELVEKPVYWSGDS
jgi:hypothetical protein